MSSRKDAKRPKGQEPDQGLDQTPTPPPALTPREFFTALFETVIEEAERNPAFAERLAHRIGQTVVFTSAKSTRGPAAAPDELIALDLKAARKEMGESALREKLSAYRNAELIAYIRANALSSGALSKRPKNSLVNAILRAAR